MFVSDREEQLMKKIIIMVAYVCCFFSFGISVFADSNSYSVTPLLPENQKEDSSGYFDLKVIPNQKQTLKVMIENTSDKEQNYKIYVNTATTNQNGIIDYSIGDSKKDTSMEFSLQDLIELKDPQMAISANSQKEVTMILSVPEKSFNGVLLGGITIEPVTENNEKEINNVLTRTLAIQLTESEDEVKPEVEAGAVSISQENLRNNVSIELRNIKPVVLTRVTANISIRKAKKEKPIIEQKRENLSFAPNTSFKLMNEWSKPFDSGRYIYSIQLNDIKGHEWNFEKKFTIQEREADKLNETAINENKDQNNYLSILFNISIVLVLFILVGWIIYQKKVKNQ